VYLRGSLSFFVVVIFVISLCCFCLFSFRFVSFLTSFFILLSILSFAFIPLSRARYQAAAYQPFFRAHAHIDSKRREPWLFGEEPLALMRRAVLTRYALLPYIYTLFHQVAIEMEIY
jgi:hypothetical protein